MSDGVSELDEDTGGALEGLRVLDIGTLNPGPLVAAMLGDLGADVVKVEPPTGDPLRQFGKGRGGRSNTWAVIGRNKRSIALDLASEAGQRLLLRLVKHADVLVENHPPARLAQWHCTWEELSRVNPQLVMVSVSGYGRTGPYRERAGNGTLAEAFGGLTNLTGEADGPPMLSSAGIGDSLTGIFGALGAISACYHRDARGGRGQHVDVAMYEPILQLAATGVTGYEPGSPAPRRVGSRLPGVVPRNVYRTLAGDWIVLSATTDAMVGRLLTVMGRDDPDSRARFGSGRSRAEHADELDAAVADWIAARPRGDALDALVKARLPAAPVNDLAAILSDPHVVARENVVEVEDPEGGSLPMLAPAPRLSGTPGRVRSPGPPLGKHAREICADWLGLATEEIDALEREGVI